MTVRLVSENRLLGGGGGAVLVNAVLLAAAGGGSVCLSVSDVVSAVALHCCLTLS